MGEHTAISWCDHTLNVWWGCQHAPAEPGAAPDDISEECRRCYARSFDKRVGGEHWGPDAPRRFFGDAYWNKARRWNAEAERSGKRARVFVSSMADWAELATTPELRDRMDAELGRLWQLVRECQWLDFLLLTKRADRLIELLPWHRDNSAPWPNVWIGVTCGVRRSLWRVRELRKVRAAVRFVSGEPLLEHITADDWDDVLSGGSIHWLIIGDESAPLRLRRPAQPDWIRTAREAAARHRVAFHFKQWVGADVVGISGTRKGQNGKIHLPLLDGKRHAAFPEVPQ